MSVLESYISTKEVSYHTINRKISIEDIENCIRRSFPLLYRSIRRGRGIPIEIIRYLYEHENVSMYRLKKDLNISFPIVRKAVLKLEKHGYVTHSVEKGRGPVGRYLYSLTPLGKLAYHIIFTQKPYSWLIEYLSTSAKEELIIMFMEKNKKLLKNPAFEELANYLFIKYTRVNLEELNAYSTPTLDFAIPIFLHTLEAIIRPVITLISLMIYKNMPQEGRELYALSVDESFSFIGGYPEEYSEDVISIIEDLSERNILDDSEVFQLLMDYLKNFLLFRRITSLISLVNIMLGIKENEPQADKNKLNEISKRIENIFADLLKTINEIDAS